MTTSTLPRPVRADWSSVTLAEYAALDLIRRPNCEDVLNAVWDEMHAHNPFRGESPTRLNDDGSVWLAEAHETATTTQDEHELIRLARDFVRSMGTLTTMRASRVVGYTR